MSTDDFTSNLDALIHHNADYAEHFEHAALQGAPSRRVAVVACMDARIDPARVLGLEVGEAHVIRNAGGVVTDDVVRSLCLSQRSLGTREIVLVHHTRCGLEGLDEAGFRTTLRDELGVEPQWSLESFDDPYDDVRESIRRLQTSPFIAHKNFIHGFVYDVADGRLHLVD